MTLLIVASIVAGLIPAAIASRKGYSFVLWWVMGALLFPFAVIAALLMKNVTRRCPHCMEAIHPDAIVCPHCQRDLAPAARAA